MVELGRVLGGKYRVDRVLGKGGMGLVVEATHVTLGTTFALKFLRPELSERQNVLDRFLREARAAAQLRGEHVCRVFDVSMIDGMPTLVMEKLEGIDLSKLLKQQGPLPIPLVCEYLVQVCAGMAEAHAAGFIHRDLKPGNLFRTTRPDGSALIKILDFGVARALTETDHDLTESGMILGSPSYMAPEQIKASRLADARSDLWSIGVILYELVSGAKPFRGDGITGLVYSIGLEPYPALPNIPSELDAVIARCLAKDPNLRFQNAGELARALAPFISARDSHASVAMATRLSGSAPSLANHVVTSPTEHTPSMSSDSRWSYAGPVEATQDGSTIRAATGALLSSSGRSPGRSSGRVMWIAGLSLSVAIGIGIAFGLAGRSDSSHPARAATPATTPPVAVPPAAAPPAAVEPAAAPIAEPATTPTAPIDAGVPPVDAAPKRRPHRQSKDVGESRI